jgi:hypothetical protein
VAFNIDPETLNAGPREWTVQGRQLGAKAIYVVHVNIDDLRASHPDLTLDPPIDALSARRSVWEHACEKAIANARPMPIFDDETAEKETGLSHLRIVLQPDEL